MPNESLRLDDPRHPAWSTGRVLVSDFDGTMTKTDFFQQAIAARPQENLHVYWEAYQRGEQTHFEALRAMFARLPANEAAIMQMAEATEPDPNLAAAVEQLQQAGWSVVVVSAGCQWYIGRLLEARGLQLPLLANPGKLEAGQGLRMERPHDGPFISDETGIDKLAVVHFALQHCQHVAFAGDGRPDLEPARLVPDDLRFARGWLAETLGSQGLGYCGFLRWSQIAARLVAYQ